MFFPKQKGKKGFRGLLGMWLVTLVRGHLSEGVVRYLALSVPCGALDAASGVWPRRGPRPHVLTSWLVVGGITPSRAPAAATRAGNKF